jgi:hypothetical protein
MIVTFKMVTLPFGTLGTTIQGVYIIRWDFNEFFMFHVFFK